MHEKTKDDYVVFYTLIDCANGIAFPGYGNSPAIDPKIVFNSLNNVAYYIQEFITLVGMEQYWNGDSTSYAP